MAVSSLTVAPQDPAGGEDAYVDLSFADTYHEDRGNTEWTSASDGDKKIAIREATAYLDVQFDWIGEIADENQDLDWPRDDTESVTLEDHEGRDIASDEIPRVIQHATAELAYRHITDGELLPNDTEGQIQQVKAGPVSIEYAENQGSQTHFQLAHRLVQGLTVSQGRNLVTRV